MTECFRITSSFATMFNFDGCCRNLLWNGALQTYSDYEFVQNKNFWRSLRLPDCKLRQDSIVYPWKYLGHSCGGGCWGKRIVNGQQAQYSWAKPVEEENIPRAGLHHDGLPQDPDNGLHSLRIHRGQVPGPLVTQPAQLVRARNDLQTSILPGSGKIIDRKKRASSFYLNKRRCGPIYFIRESQH